MASLRDGNLTLDAGEELHFPVAEHHPLIGCQTIRQIGNLDDIGDFQFVQDWARGFISPNRPALAAGQDELRPNVARHNFIGNRIDKAALLRHVVEETGGTLVALDFADFIVPAGSTVVLNGPWSRSMQRSL